MPEYDLVYAATLVTVAFCALMFSAAGAILLAWTVPAPGVGLRGIHVGQCAAAFLTNLYPHRARMGHAGF